MKIFLTPSSIPQLKDMNFQQRMAVIEKASQKLTTPERVMLNTIKLVLITLCFVWIFYLQNVWTIALAIVLMVLLYPVVVRPAQYSLVAKYIDLSEHQPAAENDSAE